MEDEDPKKESIEEEGPDEKPIKHEDPKKEQAADENLEEEDWDEGPEGKSIEEPELEIAFATESEPEPEATYWRQGRCSRMYRGTRPLDAHRR